MLDGVGEPRGHAPGFVVNDRLGFMSSGSHPFIRTVTRT